MRVNEAMAEHDDPIDALRAAVERALLLSADNPLIKSALSAPGADQASQLLTTKGEQLLRLSHERLVREHWPYVAADYVTTCVDIALQSPRSCSCCSAGSHSRRSVPLRHGDLDVPGRAAPHASGDAAKPITLAVRDYSVWAVWEKESLRTRTTRAAGQRGSQPGSRPGRSHDVSATGYGVSVA